MRRNLLEIVQTETPVPRSTKWARANPEKAASRQKEIRNTLRGACNGKVASARQRAKNKDLEFDIDIDFIECMFKSQQGLCAISGLPMIYRADKNTPNTFNSFSIDRICSYKGYTKDNVHLVCWGVNCAKQQMGLDQFFNFCRAVYDYNELGEIQ